MGLLQISILSRVILYSKLDNSVHNLILLTIYLLFLVLILNAFGTVVIFNIKTRRNKTEAYKLSIKLLSSCQQVVNKFEDYNKSEIFVCYPVKYDNILNILIFNPN